MKIQGKDIREILPKNFASMDQYEDPCQWELKVERYLEIDGYKIVGWETYEDETSDGMIIRFITVKKNEVTEKYYL